jgi:hypothetical protein
LPAAFTALLLTIGGAPARAQVAPVPAAGFTADSDLQAVAIGPGNVLYLSGSTSSLARRTGHWVRFDASGTRDAAWPEVDGDVAVAASDGAGGWFIGGGFTHVAGQRRAGLAHVGPGGELDPVWSPGVDTAGWDPGVSLVTSLCVVGDTVYVGGDFERIGGRPRSGLAAVDAVSGRLRRWAPRVGWRVTALAAAAGRLFVGGEFTNVGSARREHLAAFDVAGGALTDWHPEVTGQDLPGAPVTVGGLAVQGATLYVGGQFEAIGGRDRPGIAAFDVSTGALSAWNPPGVDWTMAGEGALEVAGDTVYISGAFGFACRTSEVDRSLVGLLAVDARTPAEIRWCADVRPSWSSSGWIADVAVVGDRVYVGGEFASLAGHRRKNLGVLDATTGVPGSWAPPRTNGRVSSLVLAGDSVLAGGEFNGLQRTTRPSGAAIDLDTGALLPFDPDPEGEHRLPAGVDAVAARGRSVFAAGDFVRIGGRHRRSLAKLDATTGRARRWDAHIGSGGRPHALTVRGHRLYLGGDFRRVGGRARRGLAALDTRTARATLWRADTNGPVHTLTIEDDTLYVGGDFTRIDGRRRRHVAAIDLRTGRVTSWNPSPDDPVRVLAVAGRTVYLCLESHRVAGRRRGRLEAVDAANGALRHWRADAGARIHALAVIDGIVYAGGDFTSIAGGPREHIAALDARSGALTAWDPGANDRVSALFATPAGLVAGGSFSSLGGTSQAGIGIFPAQSNLPRLVGVPPR